MKLTPDEIRQFVEKPFAFVEQTGIRALELEPRHIKLTMPLRGNENHIGIMYAGKIVEMGATAEIFKSPDNLNAIGIL